jgi:putative sterol carrier protein
VSYDVIVGRLKESVGSIDPAKISGANGVFQFNLSGDNGGSFYVKIADGKAELGEGTYDNPDVTISVSADNLLKMMEGKLNGTTAFMTGKLKVKGNMALAMKLQALM